MNIALKKYTNFECDEFESIEQSINIVKDQLDVLARIFYNFNSRDFFEGSPKKQLDCINKAVEYVQLFSELETRFMAAVKKLKQAFYDILSAVAKKYKFEYPDDKMVELSRKIKLIVDDKSRYTDWATREDIKANLQVDIILLLDEFDYPPVTIDDVYKEVLEQAENFKKYSK